MLTQRLPVAGLGPGVRNTPPRLGARRKSEAAEASGPNSTRSRSIQCSIRSHQLLFSTCPSYRDKNRKKKTPGIEVQPKQALEWYTIAPNPIIRATASPPGSPAASERACSFYPPLQEPQLPSLFLPGSNAGRDAAPFLGWSPSICSVAGSWTSINSLPKSRLALAAQLGLSPKY